MKYRRMPGAGLAKPLKKANNQSNDALFYV
jgi:hypothetical protein